MEERLTDEGATHGHRGACPCRQGDLDEIAPGERRVLDRVAPDKTLPREEPARAGNAVHHRCVHEGEKLFSESVPMIDA